MHLHLVLIYPFSGEEPAKGGQQSLTMHSKYTQMWEIRWWQQGQCTQSTTSLCYVRMLSIPGNHAGEWELGKGVVLSYARDQLANCWQHTISTKEEL
jgi:hypothetical protein